MVAGVIGAVLIVGGYLIWPQTGNGGAAPPMGAGAPAPAEINAGKQASDPSLCTPYRARWTSVAGGSDVAAIDRAIKVIPSDCRSLGAEARARRGSLVRDLAARTPKPPPDECALARDEWAQVQNAAADAVKAYRDKTPATCPDLRDKAQAKMKALEAVNSALLKQPIKDAVWVARPSAEDYGRYYPIKALRDNIKGMVSLDCLAETDGKLTCTIASETPPDMGFGDAALRVARSYRLAAQTKSGDPTAGRHIAVQFKFAVSG
jgi:hypothetical protein